MKKHQLKNVCLLSDLILHVEDKVLEGGCLLVEGVPLGEAPLAPDIDTDAPLFAGQITEMLACHVGYIDTRLFSQILIPKFICQSKVLFKDIL